MICFGIAFWFKGVNVEIVWFGGGFFLFGVSGCGCI